MNEQRTFELVKITPVLKVDEQTHMAWGICSSEAVDCDNEIADYPGTKKAIQKWSDDSLKTTAAGAEPSLGNIRVMHQLEVGGKAVKIEYDDAKKQIWLGASPKNDDIWKQLVGGYLKGYSIAGGYTSRTCDKCGKAVSSGRYCSKCAADQKMRFVPSISEISFVDRPANPEALYDSVKAGSFIYVKANGDTELRKFAGEAEKVIDTAEEQGKAAAAAFAEAVELLKRGGYKVETQETYNGPRITAEPKENRKETGTMLDTEVQALVDARFHAALEPVFKQYVTDWERKFVADWEAKQALAKAVKYLVTEPDGTTHLPYTGEDGKPNHRLMGAAWAALHGGYRGNKYEGPDKEAAISKLKKIYEKEGMELPSEKTAKPEVEKSMYQVAMLAQLLEEISFIRDSSIWEAAMEDDDPGDLAIAKELNAWLTDGVPILQHIVDHEGAELTESASPSKRAAIAQGETMDHDELLKAAKGMAGHFKKMAAHHEKMAECHKAAMENHSGMMEHCAECMGKAEGKNEDPFGKTHKAMHGFHKAEMSRHEKMHKAHAAVAEHMNKMAESHAEEPKEPKEEKEKADNSAELIKSINDLIAGIPEAVAAAVAKATPAPVKIEEKKEPAVEKTADPLTPELVQKMISDAVEKAVTSKPSADEKVNPKTHLVPRDGVVQKAAVVPAGTLPTGFE